MEIKFIYKTTRIHYKNLLKKDLDEFDIFSESILFLIGLFLDTIFLPILLIVEIVYQVTK